MKSTFSPKEIALALGVSESSLKRWADDGRLTVTRTAGGHRRIDLREAVRFARQGQMKVVRPDVLGLPANVDAAKLPGQRLSVDQTMTQLLEQGRADDVRAIVVERYLAGHSVASLCDGPIRSAMARIGELWQHSDDGVFIEHRATDICLSSLHQLRAMMIGGETEPTDNGSDRPLALGGAPAGDPYLLPSIMAACVMLEVGYKEINLGPDTPMAAFQRAIDAHQPQIVWLSCSAPESRPDKQDITKLADQLKKYDAVLAFGGRALESEPWAPVGNTLHCRTMSELAAYAHGHFQRAKAQA